MPSDSYIYAVTEGLRETAGMHNRTAAQTGDSMAAQQHQTAALTGDYGLTQMNGATHNEVMQFLFRDADLTIQTSEQNARNLVDAGHLYDSGVERVERILRT
ncbi:hypothetical protein WEI85_24830 [Actinomycetes bacterium KLBMP 9797]